MLPLHSEMNFQQKSQLINEIDLKEVIDERNHHTINATDHCIIRYQLKFKSLIIR